MKTWNNAELIILNIEETANGEHSLWTEGQKIDPFLSGGEYAWDALTGKQPQQSQQPQQPQEGTTDDAVSQRS